MPSEIESQVRPGLFHYRKDDGGYIGGGWDLTEAMRLLQQCSRLEAIAIYMERYEGASWCRWDLVVEIFDLAEEAPYIWGTEEAARW